MQSLILLSIQKRLTSVSINTINKIYKFISENAGQFANQSITKSVLQDCAYIVSESEIRVNYNSPFLARDWDPQQPICLFEEEIELMESQHNTTKSTSFVESQLSQAILSPSVFIHTIVLRSFKTNYQPSVHSLPMKHPNGRPILVKFS